MRSLWALVFAISAAISLSGCIAVEPHHEDWRGHYGHRGDWGGPHWNHDWDHDHGDDDHD